MNPVAAVSSVLASAQTAQQRPGSGEFARCLDQASEAQAAPRPAVKAPNAREAEAARTPETPVPQEAPPQDTSNAHAASEPDAVTAEGPRDDKAAAPDLGALLPGWVAAAAAPPSPLPSGGGAPDAADALRTASPLDTALSTRAAPTHGDGAQTADSPLPSTLQAEAVEQTDTPLAPAPTPATPSPLPAASMPALTAAPKAADTALASAMLPAPIDTPAFAPALATQVRWWAHDGVQQAQLLLNPAEMGPVAVKIVVVDGREARIDFSADLAATRSAIEAALPVLAAALDDSGLKLSGGGVHDGSAQRQAAWNARGVTQRTGGATGTHNSDAPAIVAVARGMVDLVA